MTKIFLSHSSGDKPFVRMLARDLTTADIGIWIDEVEIGPGDSILRKISEGLSASPFVVACLSLGSVQSAWVQHELEIAMTAQIETRTVIVLPILLGGIQKADLPLYLRPHRFLDFRTAASYDDSLRQLVQRIDPEANPSRALILDDNRRATLVDWAQNANLQKWILDYLIGPGLKRIDPSERYWGYIALGEIGGRRASAALVKGLKDTSAFARAGAEAALGHQKESKRL